MQTSTLVRRPVAVASLALMLGGAFGLAACSNGPSNDATTSTTGASTTSTTGASTTSTSGAPSTTTTVGTLVPQAPTTTEFVSPSGNISCEIDNNFGQSGITSTLCLTFSPARSVTLKTDSSLTECTGQQCLSNAGLGTPTLHYGQSITLGPFTCSSATSGITCMLGNGDGFLIAKGGVTALGNAKVTSS
jgi:hypothetical protein